MTHFLNLKRPRLLGSVLAMAALSASPTWAATATADVVQIWAADWSLVGPPDTPNLVGQAEGSGSGNLSINAAVPKGTLSGNMTLSLDTAAGELRSATEVSASLACCSALPDHGWGDFNFSSFNLVLMDDQLSVAHNGFGFMTITMLTTGSLAHSARIVDPPYGLSSLYLSNSIYGRLAIADGDMATFTETVNSTLVGLPDGQFSANENSQVSQRIEVVVPWENGLPVDLNFAYQESMVLTVRGVDAERVELTGSNSFGHTMKLFADVYDNQGNLLQGVLSSAQGLGYQSLAAVPEPASWALMALGVLGLAGWQRRAAGRSSHVANRGG